MLSAGFFADAQDFVLNYPNFTETVNHIQNTHEKAGEHLFDRHGLYPILIRVTSV
jgi:hypothetical protein